MPCIFAPSFATATLGVDRYEAGVASAMVNTCQQVGGAVGTAVLSTLFTSAVANYTSDHANTPGLAGAAEVHGYTVAFYVAGGMFAFGLLVAILVFPRRIASAVGPVTTHREPTPEAA
jgi:sugar phosphate permease